MFYLTNEIKDSESVARIQIFAYSKISNMVIDQNDNYVVGGIITENNGEHPGLFTGSRVIALGQIKQLDTLSDIYADYTNIIAIPSYINFVQAASIAKYICKINSIRECGAPLSSKYYVDGHDDVFSSLLNAMGYIKGNPGSSDIAVFIDKAIPRARMPKHIIDWQSESDKTIIRPGCDWDSYLANNNNKYPDFINTTVKKNIQLFWDLVKNKSIKPDLSQITIRNNADKTHKQTIKPPLDEFKEYNDYFENRKMPIIIECVTKNKTKHLFETIDSLVGVEHSYFKDNKNTVMIGYRDGSIASILLAPECESEHIECHFDGITIVKDENIISLY